MGKANSKPATVTRMRNIVYSRVWRCWQLHVETADGGVIYNLSALTDEKQDRDKAWQYLKAFRNI